MVCGCAVGLWRPPKGSRFVLMYPLAACPSCGAPVLSPLELHSQGMKWKGVRVFERKRESWWAALAGTMDARLGWRVDVDEVFFVAEAARRFSHPTRRSRALNILFGQRWHVAADLI